jgi:putative acetyltransferase
MVRELGFLQSAYVPAGVPHSLCHALVELAEGELALGELADRMRLDKSTTSRVGDKLVAEGWAKVRRDPADDRRRVLQITPAGRKRLAKIDEVADARVDAALAVLAPGERTQVLKGLELYAKALGRSRERAGYTIRPIRKTDNPKVAAIIRAVMPEFGASGPGFAIHDAEVDDMFGAYRPPRAAYFVIENGEGLVGGGGIAPLEKGAEDTCELKKMYFLPAVRGLGLGQELISRCLDAAREAGFRRCYLETLETMHKARALYERNGFEKLCGPEGATGHFGCDRFYARPL